MDARSTYLARPWLKFYEPGVPAEIAPPQGTLADLFDQAAERYASRSALIFYGREITYRQLREETNRLADSLSRLGLKVGDRVALFLLNSPQFVIAYFALQKLGCTVTPISPVHTSHEVRYQLNDSGARIVICQDILYDKIARCEVELDQVIVTSISEYLPALQKMLAKTPLARLFGEAAPAAQIPREAKVLRFQDLIAQGSPNFTNARFDPATTLAALPYTGGTTGHPKGVMLTHANLIAARAAGEAVFTGLDKGREVAIAFLPFFHIYGQVTIMLGNLYVGATLVLFTTPHTEAIIEAAQKYHATAFYGVPTLYEYLKDHKDTAKVDWKQFKLILSGADTLHESTARGWAKRTGASITEGYGLTECAASSHVNPRNRPKTGSFGLPVPGSLAAVINPESGDFVPPGETGELIISSASVMHGYWNKPEESAKVLHEAEGRTWLRTGDLVRMDEEGYFHFYDRSKDLIKYKGYSVFAKDIEQVLYEHERVKAAGVIGVPDPEVGQRIKAIVVLHPEARGKVSEEEIIAYCRQHLAEYKVPQLVEFRGELPKTDVGKVSRRELREEHEAS
ncbi:MAG: long-chain fatty acid--CoA ligase [Burkholderiales bacterium]|nr:MAG: long-chain fatty acid--CoA ligase [Burkholderiales bacterium]